jgi:hypothetical protein
LVFTHILTKCTVQEAKFQVKISSGSVARRDLIPALRVNETSDMRQTAAKEEMAISVNENCNKLLK